jgi:hypothetical protein
VAEGQFTLAWQIVPAVLMKMLQDQNAERKERYVENEEAGHRQARRGLSEGRVEL